MSLSHRTPELRPALSRPLRVPIAVVALVATVAVVVLAGQYAGDCTPGLIDVRAREAVAALWPRPGPEALVIDSLGDPRIAAVLVGLLVLTCLALGRRRLAILAIAGPAVTGITTTALKPIVDRTIHGVHLAFPSGHTGVATALALVVALLLVDLLRVQRRAAVLMLAGAAVGAGGLMAMTQVALGAHYATDTAGGLCTAVAVVMTAAWLLDPVGDALGPRA